MNRVSIASDNGLSPIRRQAIIWTNAGLLSIGPLGTHFSEILIKIITFHSPKIHLKMSSAKWRSFCPRGNELSMPDFGRGPRWYMYWYQTGYSSFGAPVETFSWFMLNYTNRGCSEPCSCLGSCFVWWISCLLKTSWWVSDLGPRQFVKLKRKCHFEYLFITGSTRSCNFDNFRCSQWCKCCQNDNIFGSVSRRCHISHICKILLPVRGI